MSTTSDSWVMEVTVVDQVHGRTILREVDPEDAVVTMIWDYGRGCGVEDVVGARYQVTMMDTESDVNRRGIMFTREGE